MAGKLLLVSVIMAMVVVPILAARDKSPMRALRRTLLLIFIFNMLYLLAVRYVYPYLA